MTSKRKIVCDECGKEADELVDAKCAAFGWFWIRRLRGGYRTPKGAKDAHISFDMNDDDDPDFCSIECAVKWLTGFLKHATSNRNKFYKGFRFREE